MLSSASLPLCTVGTLQTVRQWDGVIIYPGAHGWWHVELGLEPGQSCARDHASNHYIIICEFPWDATTPACTVWAVPKEPRSCFLDFLTKYLYKEQI